MIYYKISFLIVLISVVCFSVGMNPQEALRIQSDILTCTDILHGAFDGSRSPTKFVQYAIKDLKLYGKYPDVLHEVIIRYYAIFHNYILLKSVILPEKFCNKKEHKRNKEECEGQLRIFKQCEDQSATLPRYPSVASSNQSAALPRYQSATLPRNQSAALPRYQSAALPRYPSAASSNFPVFSKEEQDLVLDAISHARQLKDPSAASSKKKVKYSEPWDPSSNPSAAPSSSNNDSETMIILKNALYYHVTYDSNKRKMPSEEGEKIYVHVARSYGYLYLLEIARCIKIDTDKFPTPTKFCTDLYSKRNWQNNVDEDVVATYLNLDGQC